MPRLHPIKILGTHSVAESRIIINENFEWLSEGLVQVTEYIDQSNEGIIRDLIDNGILATIAVTGQLSDAKGTILDISGYNEYVIQPINNRINTVTNYINTQIGIVDSKIDEEINNRIEGDRILQEQIDNLSAGNASYVNIFNNGNKDTLVLTNDLGGVIGTDEQYTLKISDILYDEISYSELVQRINDKTLVVGKRYRLIDYTPTSTQSNTEVVEREDGYFDIILTAISNSEFNDNVMLAQHDGSSYFANTNLNKFEAKYSVSNYLWCDEENGTGVIYYMKDDFGNEAYFDFKNIKITFDDDLESEEPIYEYLFGDESTDQSLYGRVYSNTVEPYYNEQNVQEINRLHFIVTDDSYCYDNIVRQNSNNYVFGLGATNYYVQCGCGNIPEGNSYYFVSEDICDYHNDNSVEKRIYLTETGDKLTYLSPVYLSQSIKSIEVV